MNSANIDLPPNIALNLDYERYYQEAEKLYDQYQQNTPFPHTVIDGMFDNNLLQRIADECGEAFKDIEKNFYGSKGKHATSKRKYWGPYTSALLQELNSAEFLKFLESLTGIEGLIGDPYYEGGGIHETKKGGFLKVHTDFNYHKTLKLDRRINLLLYLNSDWKEEYGGNLELWDTDMSSCQRKLLPVINRMVIFSTTDFSYHGHPEPLNCPDNRSRRSLALYYYTNGRPASEVKFSKSTKTNYQQRPGEVFEGRVKKSLGKRLRKKIGKLFKK